MRHLTMSHKVFVLGFAALFALAAWAPSSRADHPQPHQMDEVQTLAWQVQQDAGILVQVARQEQHHYDEQEERALRYFEELYRVADHFYRDVRRYQSDPGHTESVFRDLMDTYRQARPHFHLVHGTTPVQRAIDRLRDSFRQLVGYYRYEGGGYGGGYGGGSGGGEHLWQSAASIERLAEQLDERVSWEERRRDYDKDDVDRVQRINDAAENFYERVRKNPNDLGSIRHEYRELVGRLRDARRVIGNFSSTTQDYYNRLWSLVSRLNYLDQGGENYDRRGYGNGYGSSYGNGYGSSYGSGHGSSYGSGYGDRQHYERRY